MSETSASPKPDENLHYPEDLLNNPPEHVPEGVELSEWEGTPEGYTELEWQYRDVQRALALDFDHHIVDTERSELEKLASPIIDRMNVSRRESGAEPIAISEVSDNWLQHAVRPEWHEHIPADDKPESEQEWESFKKQFPEHMQINLDELRLLDGKLRLISSDERLRKEVIESRHERIDVMRAASAYIGLSGKIEGLSRRITSIQQAAGASNRPLTVGESRHIERLQNQQVDLRASTRERIREANVSKHSLRTELERREDIQRRRDFEHGLVMTRQMQEVINEVMPALTAGKPVLLVGETGGAKTALAEYIATEHFDKDPEFVSGSAELNVYQLMGKASLQDGNSGFQPGPVVRAMEAGVPLIIDEANAIPSEIIKRFNKIAQLRPGDTYTVQEDSGYQVTVRPGFCIIATMNEKSKRYKGVDDLSVEFRNRFGANVINVHYPDHDVPYGADPVENAMIAKAALTDRSGNMVGDIPTDKLESFVRAAYITQQIFSGQHGEGLDMFISSDRIVDKKPGLDEAVIAPRTMVAILEKVRDSHGSVSLEHAIGRFVDGIKSDLDRKVIISILDSQSPSLISNSES